MAKCIRCEQRVRIGSTEQCPRNPARPDPHEGVHEVYPHHFVAGAFDGLCNFTDTDFGFRCGYGLHEYEEGITGAPVHELVR
jgi:hypothetical protein